ncbi:hypothetical protein NBRC116592_17070 [Colwellia sp. KU-HH00111]|uniref:hypothetical protein n=1 Tax=Colwellia sp. KU-HH00111 TaxID=3127652 RepID=UPI00310ADE2A
MNKFFLFLGLCCFTASGTTINIKYSETEKDNKVGFYDRTVRTPTDDNPGETVGEARRYALEYAAKMIESQVHSEADILIDVFYSSGIPYAASTISNTYTHRETSNYDGYGILKDDVKYSELIRRMLQNDTNEMPKNYNDAVMQFNYKGSNFEINPVDGVDAGFIHLALHEMVHALGFGRMSCIGECTDESAAQISQLSDHIYVVAPYDSKWDEMSLSDKNLAAVESNKIFYYGNQAMVDYLFDNLTTGINDNGIELHSEPLSDGTISGQTLGHLSPNVSPAQLMTSRVGNTLSIGASAYILCDIGWCRNDGFVTDFELNAVQNERLNPNELTLLRYGFSNPNDHVLENVFIEFNVYEASVINFNELNSKCVLDGAIITCNIGDMAAFEEQSIDLPFSAPIGAYRIMSNIYSKSHVVDINGFNNVDVQIVKVGQVEFPEIAIESGYSFESESSISLAPTFETNSALTFNWSINLDSSLAVEFQQNSQTGELTFDAPTVAENSSISFTLVVTFEDKTESFDVMVTITPRADDTGTGTDTGSGSNNGSGTGNGSSSNNNNQITAPNSNDESSGGSFNLFFLLMILSEFVKRCLTTFRN